jgi:hypothetical protein
MGLLWDNNLWNWYAYAFLKAYLRLIVTIIYNYFNNLPGFLVGFYVWQALGIGLA